MLYKNDIKCISKNYKMLYNDDAKMLYNDDEKMISQWRENAF